MTDPATTRPTNVILTARLAYLARLEKRMAERGIPGAGTFRPFFSAPAPLDYRHAIRACDVGWKGRHDEHETGNLS